MTLWAAEIIFGSFRSPVVLIMSLHFYILNFWYTRNKLALDSVCSLQEGIGVDNIWANTYSLAMSGKFQASVVVKYKRKKCGQIANILNFLQNLI